MDQVLGQVLFCLAPFFRMAFSHFVLLTCLQESSFLQVEGSLNSSRLKRPEFGVPGHVCEVVG